MIVPMKKVYVLVRARDITLALEKLRGCGVVHVEHWQDPVHGQVPESRARLVATEKACLYLEPLAHKMPPAETLSADQVVAETLTIIELIDEINDDVARREKALAQWTPWGAIDPLAIADLRTRGFTVALYEGPAGELKGLPQDTLVERFTEKNGVVRSLVIRRGDLSLPAISFELPEASLSDIKAALMADKARIFELEARCKVLAGFYDMVQAHQSVVLRDLRFEEAGEGMLKDGPVAVLKGFCPQDSVVLLDKAAAVEGWGIVTEEPSAEDQVPTVLRNPEWVRVIMPLFDFMGILPGYREADVSLCFLVFFSLFFGILIGDAGYGALFLVGTLFVKGKVSPKADPAPFRLMLLLSLCAIAWGMATGTFFGISLFGQWVKPLVPWLTDNTNMMFLCFVIGVVHLTIAHLWRGLRKFPSVSALSELGWIALLWSGYFLSGQIILEKSMPSFTLPLLWSGAGIVIFFNQPRKNILLGAGLGLSDLLLGIMGVFIDLISYIRLFAVGAASLALAEAFNAAVTALGFSNVLAGLGTALILVVGHSLNIILSLMAVLVHGLRLNILEFSGHQGIEWAGVKYEPFKKD